MQNLEGKTRGRILTFRAVSEEMAYLVYDARAVYWSIEIQTDQIESLKTVCNALDLKKKQITVKVSVFTASHDRVIFWFEEVPLASRCVLSLAVRTREYCSKSSRLTSESTANSFITGRPVRKGKKAPRRENALSEKQQKLADLVKHL